MVAGKQCSMFYINIFYKNEILCSSAIRKTVMTHIFEFARMSCFASSNIVVFQVVTL